MFRYYPFIIFLVLSGFLSMNAGCDPPPGLSVCTTGAGGIGGDGMTLVVNGSEYTGYVLHCVGDRGITASVTVVRLPETAASLMFYPDARPSITINDGEKIKVDDGYVYFVSSEEILNKVSYETLGIQSPRDAASFDMHEEDVRSKLETYLKEHGTGSAEQPSST